MSDAVTEADFIALLREHGQLPQQRLGDSTAHAIEPTEGTTILAVRYQEGVLVAGDRRATMGNTVVYDRADKVLAVDDRSVIALAGSPANAYEIVRMLEMSFQHYRRSQLQELSLEGRLRTLSRLLRENLPMAMQRIGAVIPIYAMYDETDSAGRIYFYDILGAQFESVDFCTTGSGSTMIRGALYYQNRWDQSLAQMDEAQSLELILKMLETAAEYDTATGGFRPTARIFPQVMRVNAKGISTVDESVLESLYQTRLSEQG